MHQPNTHTYTSILTFTPQHTDMKCTMALLVVALPLLSLLSLLIHFLFLPQTRSFPFLPFLLPSPFLLFYEYETLFPPVIVIKYSLMIHAQGLCEERLFTQGRLDIRTGYLL
jgi:hypothetical protein